MNEYIITKLIENKYILLNELKGRRNCTLIIKRYKNFELDNVILEEIKSSNIKLIFRR